MRCIPFTVAVVWIALFVSPGEVRAQDSSGGWIESKQIRYDHDETRVGADGKDDQEFPVLGGVPIYKKIEWNAECKVPGHALTAKIWGMAVNTEFFAQEYNASVECTSRRRFYWKSATNEPMAPVKIYGLGTYFASARILDSYLIDHVAGYSLAKIHGPGYNDGGPEPGVQIWLNQNPNGGDHAQWRLYETPYQSGVGGEKAGPFQGLPYMLVYTRARAECWFRVNYLPGEPLPNPSHTTDGITVGHIEVDMLATVSGHDSTLIPNRPPPVP